LRKRSRSSVVQRFHTSGAGCAPVLKAATAASTSAKACGIGGGDVGGNARLIDPAVELQLLLERLVALDQMLADVGEEDR
jgi:hypothetical protein